LRVLGPAAAALGLGMTLAAWPLGAGHEGDGTRTLRQVVYDLGVTSYCNLLTPEVEAGYHREIARLTERAGLNEEDAKALRIAGWVDADREWGNRGLGGFRAWCETDGLAAARHFLAIMRGPARP
jgi:hypothetical protein